MHKTAVINVVGLTPSLIGEHTPFLTSWSARKRRISIKPVLPAVTCTAQATYLTGKMPAEHGIVANGWYFRAEAEVKLWRQSNRLVEANKIWEEARRLDPSFTCANMFWWYNMYSTVDYSATPRPQYRADGLKLPDIYTEPADLREELQQALGGFPLFQFWGPATSIASSRWIADASLHVDDKYDPTLTLIYLPHLDYNLQRFGPDLTKVASDLREVDAVVKDLVMHYEQQGARVVVLSEYGIAKVDQPVHINRMLRSKGWLRIRKEGDGELLDAGASQAFAVADHQVAHVYVHDQHILPAVKSALSALPGVDRVIDKAEQASLGLAHRRSGDLLAVATPDAWFTYYYWEVDELAPDFARTVDIHRKPGYDPVEMFVDPSLSFPKLKILSRLVRKKMGMRYLMDVIPLDAALIRGSHGRVDGSAEERPLLISNWGGNQPPADVHAPDVYHLLWDHLTK